MNTLLQNILDKCYKYTKVGDYDKTFMMQSVVKIMIGGAPVT